ncbi:MAG: AIR synthase-related protein, partial [Bdellovibrionota bacterium]
QKRMADFLLEARDLGLFRAITDNGAGGLSSSVGELARLSGGARMDVSRAKTKYPGLKPFELVVSESQERMTLAVPPSSLEAFTELATRRNVEVSELGEFNDSGKFEIFFGEKQVASLDLKFLHQGAPKLELKAEWKGKAKPPESIEVGIEHSFENEAGKMLVELLGRPNISSKEWLIRQYDHEVQGMSVVKPLHLIAPGTPQAMSGPNDAGVLKPKVSSDAGIAVGCGINPRLSDIDPYLMAQSVVDEAVRNVLCVGAEFGTRKSVLALVDNFCWPDPVKDSEKAAALVRACFGLREAALALGAPLVSGKDSMKNDYRGRRAGEMIQISVPPTLLMTAVARVADVRVARTADFKAIGDLIYLLGGKTLGLWGSEFQSAFHTLPGKPRLGTPDWEEAKKLYSWIGGSLGKEQAKLRSLHDLSDGGLLVAIAESCLARGFGARIEPSREGNPWEWAFGEGFHSFVATVSENDASALEAEWSKQGIRFSRVGVTIPKDELQVGVWSVGIKQLRAAWLKEGYWE